MRSNKTQVTQRTVAEKAGVSQATVSLVLNGRDGGTARIPAATRDRVLQVIRETGYVASPVARSLVGATNDLIGIFTYEPAFPSRTSDFYTPLLTGIEVAAEKVKADLLLFTSTPLEDGRRRLFHENNRLRLADACILLGRRMDPDELARLVHTDYPFVAIGRRDGKRIPYVGVDYVTPVRELARRALKMGHRRLALLHRPLDAESSRDRRDGLLKALPKRGKNDTSLIEAEVSVDTSVVDAWQQVQSHEPTVVFVEDPDDGSSLMEHLAGAGIEVPRQLSVVALGEHTRSRDRAGDVTRLSAPRTELGTHAVDAITAQIAAAARGDRPGDPVQELLPCTVVDGTTLAPPIH